MKNYHSFSFQSLFITALLLTTINGYGQELAQEKSQEHRLIEGTNIYMVPPPMFLSSTNFKGFQNPDDQTSMIMTLGIPGPYSEVIKGFEKETLETNGMELISKKEIRVAGFTGLLVELNQPSNGFLFSKQLLVYGNEQATTIINGTYIKDSVALGKRIKESILTTYVDIELKSNPRDALSYSIDETQGSLKFHSVIGNGMLLNRDLKIPTESEDKATLITDKSFAKVEINDKRQFCESRLEEYPEGYTLSLEKGINPVELDGLDGFELFAENQSDASEEMYQVILFDDDGGYYLFLGTYDKASQAAISDIKSVIYSFKRKE